MFVFLCILLLCFVSVAVFFQTDRAAPQAKVLSVWNGYIAVFENGDPLPAAVYDTPIASLPQREAERLYAGIAVETDDELQRLIEDYCS